MREIPLSHGLVAIIDDEDYTLVSQYKWNTHPGGRTSYAARKLWVYGRQTEQYMHTLITKWKMVDHIDGDGLNNRRVNIRPATYTQNNRNRRKMLGTSSQYKGVTWNKPLKLTTSFTCRWRARIMVDGQMYHLGMFNSEIDAALAYDAAAREHFGEYAWLNFPDMLVK